MILVRFENFLIHQELIGEDHLLQFLTLKQILSKLSQLPMKFVIILSPHIPTLIKLLSLPTKATSINFQYLQIHCLLIHFDF